MEQEQERERERPAHEVACQSWMHMRRFCRCRCGFEVQHVGESPGQGYNTLLNHIGVENARPVEVAEKREHGPRCGPTEHNAGYCLCRCGRRFEGDRSEDGAQWPGFDALTEHLADPERVPEGYVGLTEPELRVVKMLGDVASVFALEIVGNGDTREHDVNEFVAHVHALQHTVMAQAAARAHPELLRLLGGTL